MPQAKPPFWHMARNAYPGICVALDSLDTIATVRQKASRIGDTLFEFVCYECAAVSEGEPHKTAALTAMLRAMHKAREQLDAVITGLECEGENDPACGYCIARDSWYGPCVCREKGLHKGLPI